MTEHETEQDQDLEKHEKRGNRIGLSLSGGGHRAAIFHLGVLARLADGKLLDNVKLLSTVSGGSVAAALIYAENNNTWITNDKYPTIIPKLTAYLTKRNLELQLAGRFLLPPYWALFRNANCLADALRDQWGVRGNLSDLPATPDWVINATTIETGKSWRFDRKVMGDYKFGYTPSGDFPISQAVAASAGFPGLIGPLLLKTTGRPFVKFDKTARDMPLPVQLPIPKDQQAQLASVNLWDGGVYDNIGVLPILHRLRLHDAESITNAQVFREARRVENSPITEQQEAGASKPAAEKVITPEEDLKRRNDKSKFDLDFMIFSDASTEFQLSPYRRWNSIWRLVVIPSDHTRMMYSAQVVSMMRRTPNLGAYFQLDNKVRSILYGARSEGKKNEAKRIKDNRPYDPAKDDTIKVRSLTDAEIEAFAAECLTDTQVKLAGEVGTTFWSIKFENFKLLYQHGYEVANATLFAYNGNLGNGFDFMFYKDSPSRLTIR